MTLYRSELIASPARILIRTGLYISDRCQGGTKGIHVADPVDQLRLGSIRAIIPATAFGS